MRLISLLTALVAGWCCVAQQGDNPLKTTTMTRAFLGKSDAGSALDTITNRFYENVLWYGADPTTVANSTAAFQAAFNAARSHGRSVYVPHGTYKISELNITNSNMTLWGDGSDNTSTNGTRLIRDSGNYIINIGDDTAQVLNVRIENILFDGNHTNCPNLLQIGGGAENVVIARCQFFNGYNQFWVTGGTNHYTRQITFDHDTFQLFGDTNINSLGTVAYPASGSSFLQNVYFNNCQAHPQTVGFAVTIDGIQTVHSDSSYWGLVGDHGFKFQDTSTASGHAFGTMEMSYGTQIGTHTANAVLVESSAGGLDSLGDMLPGAFIAGNWKDSAGVIHTNQPNSPSLPSFTYIDSPVFNGIYVTGTGNNVRGNSPAHIFGSSDGLKVTLQNQAVGGTIQFSDSTGNVRHLILDQNVEEVLDQNGNVLQSWTPGSDIALKPAGVTRIYGTNVANVILHENTSAKEGEVIVDSSGNTSLETLSSPAYASFNLHGTNRLLVYDNNDAVLRPFTGILDVYNTDATNTNPTLRFEVIPSGASPSISGSQSGDVVLTPSGTGKVQYSGYAPAADSTTALTYYKADRSTAVGVWDTTNSRFGIGMGTAPTYPLEVHVDSSTGALEVGTGANAASSIYVSGGRFLLGYDGSGGYLNNSSGHGMLFQVNGGSTAIKIASTAFVDIGNATATSRLQVDGSFAPMITTGGSVSLDEHHTYLVNANSQTITLPNAATRTGRVYVIKNITPAVSTTIATSLSQLIDGAASASLASSNAVIRVQSDGANWWTW